MVADAFRRCFFMSAISGGAKRFTRRAVAAPHGFITYRARSGSDWTRLQHAVFGEPFHGFGGRADQRGATAAWFR